MNSSVPFICEYKAFASICDLYHDLYTFLFIKQIMHSGIWSANLLSHQVKYNCEGVTIATIE